MTMLSTCTEEGPVRGGELVVASLLAHGIDTVFCVPGESFLPVLDALRDVADRIRLIVCRHEAAAAHAAEAYAKITGRPGVCMVTRGPGATQAAIGVHTAAQDSTPLVLLIGQVDSGFIGRNAWQEIDAVSVFGTLAKRVEQFDRAQRIPEILARAFQSATADRPGPAVVAMPEDVLYARARSATPIMATPSAANTLPDLRALQPLLDASHRPLLIVGGGGWSEFACAQLRAFAERHSLPVATSFRRQDLFDNTHPQYAGPLGIGSDPALARRVKFADLVLAIGTRLGETTTSGYTLLAGGPPERRLVHVHPGRAELGCVHAVDLAVHATADAFLDAARSLEGNASGRDPDWMVAAHADYLATLVPPPCDSDFDFATTLAWLRERLPRDAILTNGAGNYTGWVHRYLQHRATHTQLAPISGAMGYGIPAAIAAKLAHPGRLVVCFAGDGCFQMSAQELATARQYGLAIVIVVVNNAMYGSIRMHQELNFPGRVHGTDLMNPDFTLLARAHGLPAWRVSRTAEFAPAFDAAAAAPQGALIELCTDPQQITTRSRLPKRHAGP